MSKMPEALRRVLNSLTPEESYGVESWFSENSDGESSNAAIFSIISLLNSSREGKPRKYPLIVTENKDLTIDVKAKIPGISDKHFVQGSGKYSATSLARTILATKYIPVVLILDNKNINSEDKEFFYGETKDSLRSVSPGIPFIICMGLGESEIHTIKRFLPELGKGDNL